MSLTERNDPMKIDVEYAKTLLAELYRDIYHILEFSAPVPPHTLKQIVQIIIALVGEYPPGQAEIPDTGRGGDADHDGKEKDDMTIANDRNGVAGDLRKP